MRSDGGMDQAEGLRRLLVLNQAQVVMLVAGKAGTGRTAAVINLAAALARSGKDVLVVDENSGPNNLLDRLGLSARYDLLDVVLEKCGLCDAVLATPEFGVLSTSRAVHAVKELGREGRRRLEEALVEAGSGADVVLVDVAMPVFGHTHSAEGMAVFPEGQGNSAALVVMVEATPSGITESYALIKRLALRNALQQFGVVVNRADNDQTAITVFENMAKVARRNLSVRLEYLGYVPTDDRLKCALQLGKSVAETFPSAASAQSYLELSQRLLGLPMRRGEAESRVSSVKGNLMKRAPQPAVTAS